MEDDDFKAQELINIKLPRKRYELLNKMLAREEAYGWLTQFVTTNWIWIVAGGVLTVWGLWDKIQGVIK